MEGSNLSQVQQAALVIKKQAEALLKSESAGDEIVICPRCETQMQYMHRGRDHSGHYNCPQCDTWARVQDDFTWMMRGAERIPFLRGE